MKKITQKRLSELFLYDPFSGYFTRKCGVKGSAAGSLVGTILPNGSRAITVDGVSYRAHRLACLYVLGYLPDSSVSITHLDGDKDNNAISNLGLLSRVKDLAGGALTPERLKSVLSYDTATGVFTRLNTTFGAVTGSEAGHLESNGYIRITVDGQPYLAHRLAFLYMTGSFPASDVDHIDRNRSNNAWANLREVSKRMNQRNMSPRSGSSSGITGVSYSKTRGLWVSHIKLPTGSKYLGGFGTKGAAAHARLVAERQYGWPAGTSAEEYLLAHGFLRDGMFRHKLIGLCGQACSGKTSVLEHMKSELGGTVIKFADQIYKALPGEKNRAFMCEYGDLAKKYYSDSVFRDKFTESVMFSDSPVIICDDIRTPPEAAVAKQLGFTLISVECPDAVREARSEALGLEWLPGHNSENQVVEAAKLADYVIVNSSTIDHLKAITKDILGRIQ